MALEFSKENDGYGQRRKGSWRASFHPSIVHRFSFKEHYSNILSTRMSKPGRGDELLKALALLAKCGRINGSKTRPRRLIKIFGEI